MSKSEPGFRVDPGKPDGGCSRPSKNNRQEPHEGLSPEDDDFSRTDLPNATGNRPISVTDGVNLRDEAVVIRTDDGDRVPCHKLDEHERPEGDRRARPWYAVLNEWRDWMDSPLYQAGHLTFENGDGEMVRTKVENSYMESYSSRYYARLKDLERGVRRKYGADNVTTVMLTLSSSNENENGGSRCPGDHMREIAGGWATARKQLPHILEGYEYCYARIWEPHDSGYGHQHVALFIYDPNERVDASQFRRFMNSYTENTAGAGTQAHSNEACEKHDHGGGWNDAVGSCDDCRSPVSVNDDVENVGSYISEYIGIFGEETLERPLTEQMFYATCWATNTRRLDFGQDAQDIISGEEFRRETGLRPSDRGESDGDCKPPEPPESDGESPADRWEIKRLCAVPQRTREHSDPMSGGVTTTEIDGIDGVDPPKWVE